MVVGELANFAAYAFAPAILVTPLGALSVLIGYVYPLDLLNMDGANCECFRAVLGTYFLDEKLGILGKIGCAICLIGSVIIVLHAPPDEDVETIDVLLHYAMRPGLWSPSDLRVRSRTDYVDSVHVLLLSRYRIRRYHDLQGRSQVRSQEPTCLHIHLQYRRQCFDHGDQGIRHRAQTHICWKQPIRILLDIRLHDCGSRMHSHANELLQ